MTAVEHQSIPVYQVYLGSVGWHHPHWTGAFYPAELPEEWELAYYSNYFRCVYLDHAAWSKGMPEMLWAWRDEVVPGFRFLLEECPGGDPGHSFVPVSGPGDSRLVWFDATTDLRGLADILRDTDAPGPLYLISRDADLKRLHEIAALLELLGL